MLLPRMLPPASLCALALLAAPIAFAAQAPPEIAAIMARLDKLEQENRVLAGEVRDLRAQLAATRAPQLAATDAPPATAADPPGAAPDQTTAPDQSGAAPKATTEERLDILEHRVDEQAQTKVEASQRFPIRLTGMALFNSFLDSSQSGGQDYPTVAAAAGPGRAGATLRQTMLGLEFRGPQTLWGGNVHGSIYMDFYQGAAPLDEWLRLRTGSIQIDWQTRSVMVGVDKPIFNPRDPDSLAQVGVSPLTGAGNLWLWLPQVRVEEDFAFSSSSGLRARLGAVETHEVNPYGAPPANNARLEAARPGLEGRFEAYHNLDDQRRFEISAGFHLSTTHDSGFSVPSRVVSADWFFNPWKRLEFSGAFFSGENVASLGTGSINQGYYIAARYAEAINTLGGWGQLTVHAAPRLDFHIFTGQQQYQEQQLRQGSVGKNLMFGSNLYFRVAPNVLLGPEISQLRSLYVGQGTHINNHYDLALAYLF